MANNMKVFTKTLEHATQKKKAILFV